MRLGLIARADNSGLGMQTWEFYRHMFPARTMVVDISSYNSNKTYNERYNTGEVMFVRGFPTPNDIDNFLSGLDVVFIAEAAYNPYLYDRAKELGVKTAVQYNYEFMDWLINPNYPKPDMLIAPSKWHYEEVQAWCDNNNVKHVYLHCPVNRDLLPMRTITEARTFLHVAGRSAAHDRNGTDTVIEAGKYLKTNAQILIHFQGQQGLAHQATTSLAEYTGKLAGEHITNVTIQVNEFDNYADVYTQGDVLLLPRRYGGNCLPLNEALSIGMPVIMPDISPNNEFLPKNWLVPANWLHRFAPRTTVDVYGSDPADLASKIDEFYNMDKSQMWFENVQADKLAQTISWPAMRGRYEQVLGELCTR